MIDKLNTHYSFTSPASVHDEEALTALELAGRQGAKINEIIESQNNLESETNTNLAEQDSDIRTKFANQDRTIEVEFAKQNKAIPEKITEEVQNRIDDGSFEEAIDEHLGNLESRVNSILNDSSGGNNEVVDIRVNSDGMSFSNAGESVRHAETFGTIPLTFNVNKTFSESGWRNQPGTAYKVSNGVKINPNWVYIYFKNKFEPNSYVAQVLFTRDNNYRDDEIVQAVHITGIGEHKLPIPSGAKYVYVANEVDFNGVELGEPGLYYNRYEAESVAGEIYSALTEFYSPADYGYSDQLIDYYNNLHVNKSMRSNGEGGVEVRDVDGFNVYGAVNVEGYTSLLLDVLTANPYYIKYAFSTSDDLTQPMMYGDVVNTRGRYSIIPPKGAKFMFVADDTDIDGKRYTAPRVYGKTDRNVDNILNMIEFPEYNVHDNSTIEIPEGYVFNAVVGKPFELYYNGLIHTADIENYYVEVVMDVGTALKRKYTYTPTAEDVGAHTGSIILRNFNGDVEKEKSFTINVVNPTTGQVATVLTIGDSLTSGGEWITELRTLIASTDKNSIRFMGDKIGTGNIPNTNARFEATPGAPIAKYYMPMADNPFYNTETGKIDISWYMSRQTYKNLDYCIIFLGWNDVYHLNRDNMKGSYELLITHIRESFPDCKIILVGLQKPDVDGLGVSYGTSWPRHFTVTQMYHHFDVLNEIAESDPKIKAINIAARFDSLYNMPSEMRPVNPRNTTTERVITNGVHPSNEGYMQIADIIYAELTAYLQEGM